MAVQSANVDKIFVSNEATNVPNDTDIDIVVDVPK